MNKLDRFNKAELANNPRATLAAWRRYEPLAVAAFRKHPQEFYWVPPPNGLSCETVVSRIRDAIRGKIAFDYPSQISNDDFINWFSKVIFKVIKGGVFIGPRKSLKDRVPLGVVEDKQDGLSFETLDLDEAEAFALLLSRGRLSGPIVIRKPVTFVNFPSYPNFHTIPRPDGSLVLL